MDRDRLKEVRRTEQTESRINEDFVEWLKTSGLTWLVLILVVLVGYILLVRWRGSVAQHQINAWTAYSDSQVSGLPSGYLSVAEQYGDVDSVGLLARIQAGRRWLTAVQVGQPLDATRPDEVLAERDRDHYLDRADEAFRAVLARDDGGWHKTLLMINALNGRAAVAEARGQIEDAQRFYEQAAQRAGSDFPHLAEQARQRAETVGLASRGVELPSEADLAAAAPVEADLTPAEVDDALRDLLMPR